jgi:hypothetical protein
MKLRSICGGFYFQQRRREAIRKLKSGGANPKKRHKTVPSCETFLGEKARFGTLWHYALEPLQMNLSEAVITHKNGKWLVKGVRLI